ncbi:MAG: C13 family peptidase [Rhizomicrobium sp.]|nr:C13 family peptidase [Rhizomicrobium sp.]
MKTLLALLLFLLAALPAEAASFADWAAVVVAGDSYAHEGGRTAVFDNGRSAIARGLLSIGFAPDHIAQFSDRPKKYPDGHPILSTPRNIARGLEQVASQTHGGCLAYLTSHGDDHGIGIGDALLSPTGLAKMIDQSCHGRPAVVIVSACYSGVFIPKLKAADRIVLTAAAPDRSSFGCGESDHYTFFDACVVESLPLAHDFAELGKRAIACVAAREKKEEVDLPSHPQLAVGAKAAAVIPAWKVEPKAPPKAVQRPASKLTFEWPKWLLRLWTRK